MPRPKSLLVSMEITVAGAAHNCRFNKSHRLQKGDSRLTIYEEGSSPLNYCLNCARSFLERDIDRLNGLLSNVNRLLNP
jgi:hypothetical protein